MNDRYELIVVGAGAAGLAAARAAGKGRVALIEAVRPGGECTFTGCVPSKTLIAVANRVAGVRGRDALGIEANVNVDLPTVMKHVRSIVEEIAGDEAPDVLRKEGIDFIEGRARFVDAHAIEVEGQVLRAERFVIAVGSRPDIPAVKGLEKLDVLTNESIFSLEDTPRRLAVIGGGSVGCELGQAFARLGVDVVVLEAEKRVLGGEEPEASEIVRRVLERDGVDVRTAVRLRAAQPGPVLELEGGERIEPSHVLVATGRSPSLDGLSLDAAGVNVGEGGLIEIDHRSRTNVSHIYAVGDCASTLKFTHVADEQGRRAAQDAFSRRPRRFDASVIPRVTFTDPEVASVGKTEAEAYELYGERARVAIMPIDRTDRGRCTGERDGLVKLIAAPGKVTRSLGGGRLVGMTALCSAGGELVAEGALAMTTRAFAGRLAQSVHAYPTWSIAVRQAAARWFVGLDRPARPGA